AADFGEVRLEPARVGVVVVAVDASVRGNCARLEHDASAAIADRDMEPGAPRWKPGGQLVAREIPHGHLEGDARAGMRRAIDRDFGRVRLQLLARPALRGLELLRQ